MANGVCPASFKSRCFPASSRSGPYAGGRLRCTFGALLTRRLTLRQAWSAMHYPRIRPGDCEHLPLQPPHFVQRAIAVCTTPPAGYYPTLTFRRVSSLLLIFVEIPLLLRICPTSAKFDAFIRRFTTNYMSTSIPGTCVSSQNNKEQQERPCMA